VAAHSRRLTEPRGNSHNTSGSIAAPRNVRAHESFRADPDGPRDRNNFFDGLKNKPHYDYSRDGALRSIEDSLERLKLPRIDIVFIHDIDVKTHGEAQPARFREAMEGAYRALMDLRAAGAIRAVGLGVNEWQVCRDALLHGDFDCFLLAGRYTLLDQSSLAEFMPLCLERGASVIIGGPYNSGVLAPRTAAGNGSAATYDYRPASPEILARVERIDRLAASHGIPLAAAALQFPFGHPAVVSVIPGARNVDE
jgi:D-threo-aldose 1-dehydrogenase